ncbi:MAG: hypothetical protein JWQ71_3080 [Pedosphaera sp.]|nr:hypothetical protein [Pedosphaera sp.]
MGLNRARRGLGHVILGLLIILSSTGILAAAQPPNDNFANATVISGTPISVFPFNYGASEEAGEPDHSVLTGDKSIWFSWTPTSSGPVAISTIGSALPGNDTLISVYSGTSVDALTLLAENKVNPPASQFDFPRTDNYLLLNAVVGNTYQISLDGVAEFGGGTGGFWLQILPPPTNGSFESRIQLTGEETSGSYNFFVSPGLDSGSVWWTWTAPQTGVTSFSMADTSFDPSLLLIKVYTGTALANLTEVPLARLPSDPYGQYQFAFLAHEGMTYQFAISSAPTRGFIRIRPSLLPVRPLNDDFENRSLIIGNSTTVSGSYSNATEQPFEPFHAGYSGYRSIWYSWLAPTNGTVSIQITTPLDDNLLIGVYTGNTLTNLNVTPLNYWANFFSAYATNRAVNFNVQTGTPYQIAIDKRYFYQGGYTYGTWDGPVNFDFSFSSLSLIAPVDQGRFREPESIPLQVSYSQFDGDLSRIDYYAGTNLIATATNAPFSAVWNSPPYGDFQLTAIATNDDGFLKISPPISVAVIRGNDDFNDRIILFGDTVNKTGSTLGTSRQPGEPTQGISGAGHSVWYSWTAPYTGNLLVSTAGSDEATAVGVYSGSTLSNLTLLATASDNRYYDAALHVAKGLVYQIAVDAFGNNGGQFQLHLTLTSSPSNDDFADRSLLQGTKVSATNSNENASYEAYEPIHTGGYGGHSLWWSWTAPVSGYVRVSTARTSFYTSMAVYTGSAVSNLIPVPDSDRFSSGLEGFVAQKGVTYQIAADSWDVGALVLDLEVSKVTITNPVAGASLTGPANVKIQTTVQDLDSIVKRVDFYAGSKLIGSSTVKPFGITWSNVVGSFIVTAKATDAKGKSTISRPLPIIVNAPNNAFAHATLIKGTSVSVRGYIGNCDSEPGEPSVPGFSVGQTAWWNWTAPANGQVTLSLSGTDLNPLAAVYTGPQITNLVMVANNSYQHCYGTCACENRVRSSLTFKVTAGKTYRIALDKPFLSTWDYFYRDDPYHVTTYTQTGGNLNFQLKFAAAPANDNFQNRKSLTGNHISVTASNVGATRQTGEPNQAGNGGDSSIWYTWTATISGRVTISPRSFHVPPPILSGPGIVIGGGVNDCFNNQYDNPLLPGFDPVFGVYTGTSLASLKTVTNGTEVTFDAVAGRTYQIAVDGNQGATASFIFLLNLVPPPVNDNRARATPIFGSPLTVYGYNVSATREPGDPVIAGDASGHSVWWQWMATKAGYVTINLSDSEYQFPLGVYTASPLGLKLVAQDIGGYFPHGDTQVTFKTPGGAHYFIAVGSYGGYTGNIRMNITQSPIIPPGGVTGVYPTQGGGSPVGAQ